jgi:hypothetical protein
MCQTCQCDGCDRLSAECEGCAEEATHEPCPAWQERPVLRDGHHRSECEAMCLMAE